jgi:perosamine synthetase
VKRDAARAAGVIDRKIPWWEPQMTGHELDRIRAVLDANYINDGDVTTEFERELVRLLGAKHVVAVTSGTIAIFMALVAAGVSAGDEVVVPDLTFIATANAVRLAGATPVLVDIDPKTLLLDPAAFAAAITPRTRAVVPVHVSGRGARMSEIVAIADRQHIRVVEDAAEAFGSRQGGKSLGLIGVAGAFSFSPNKTITSGQGGAVATNDDRVAARLRELKDQGRPVKGTGGDDVHPSLGFNFKFTNLQAAVGLAQLEVLDERLARQRRIYEIYSDELRGCAGIELPGFKLADGELPLWTDAIAERRDELDKYLADRGMGCRRFWFPIHTQAPYRRPDAAFPQAMRVAPHAIWLPSAFTLTDDDVHAVSRTIREFYAG